MLDSSVCMAVCPSSSTLRNSWGSVTGRVQVKSWQTYAVAAPPCCDMEERAGTRWQRKLSASSSKSIKTCRRGRGEKCKKEEDGLTC